MGGLNAGLNIGLSGVLASQSALNVVGHNITNVNTPGFSRQRVVFNQNYSNQYGGFVFGSGVTLDSIQSLRNRFLEMQINHATSRKKGAEERHAGVEGIASAFMETDDSGLSVLVNRFFQGFQELAARPEDAALRRNMVSQATSLINGLKERYRALENARTEADKAVGVLVKDVNTLTEQIAALNFRISQEPTPGSDHDARDQRKVLADRLAELIGVQVYEDNAGLMQITLDNGAAPLVAGRTAYPMSTTPDPALGNMLRVDVTMGGITVDATASIKEGSIGAKLDLRDNLLPTYQRQLDQLAAGLVGNVNLAHRAGFALDGATTGLDFFLGAAANGANGLPVTITAADNYRGMVNSMTVNAAINLDPNLIAAAGAAGAPGNNQNARAIADLANSLAAIDTNGDGTGDSGPFSRYIGSLGSLIGSHAQSYMESATTSDNLLVALENQRDQVSAVDLDEEATMMISYQRSYQASARFVNVVSELLDQLVNQFGR